MALEMGDRQRATAQTDSTSEAGKTVLNATKKVKAFGDRLSAGNEQSILRTNEQAANSQLHINTQSSSRLKTAYKSSALKVDNQYRGNKRENAKFMPNERKIEKNSEKIAKNEEKLNKLMKNRYYRDYKIKGGIKSPLRVETSMKSKLRFNPAPQKAMQYVSGKAHAGLDRINDEMDSDSLGIQNAYGVTASKAMGAAEGVYKVSRQAKNFRMMQKEKKIAKALRKENRLMKETFRLEYQQAYSSFKNTPVGQSANFFEKQKYKKFLKKKYMKNAMKQYQKAKKAGQAAKTTYTTGMKTADKVKDAFVKIFHAVRNSNIAMTVIAVGLGLAIIPTLGAGILQFLAGGYESEQQNSNPVNLPPEILQWREFVEERCTANNDANSNTDMTLFVNAILATIWQESGGIPETCEGDIMQNKACGLWETSTFPDDWTEAQKSIDVGVRYFYGGLKDWPVIDPEDFEGLQMVAQGYNYGYGFFGFEQVVKGVTPWTLELSQAYADSKGGNYGHPPYGQEWLDKYKALLGVAGSGEIVKEEGVEGVVLTALNQEGITESPANSNNVVFNTAYYGHEVEGSQYPWCCAFVWWCFEMSGNGDLVPKTAGCAYMRDHISEYGGQRIANLSAAQRGDLVIFGEGDHIGIVVENNGGGNLVTIEGNTTPENGSGSEYNGGCVAKRNRNISTSNIRAVLRPNYPD